jgi:hypothetical protein
MVRLQSDHDLFYRQSNKLLLLVRSLHPLPAEHQKLVAEVVMIRLFMLLETVVESICCKLRCNVSGRHRSIINSSTAKRRQSVGFDGDLSEVEAEEGSVE